GQQQRVFLARALAQEADLILLDEPLNGLDATTYAALLDVLERQQQAGKTVIMATHDLATAQTWCDLVIFLNTDLIAAGPPAECFTPEVLARTYGGAFVAVGGADKPQMVLHDDRHNH
ncbi:MAG: ATP-binding cassette domain-containing protein, partial [Chloroflexi bacterium]|nr:ATP-binding cassette domain-containing protein [Chloroflexota bacterium]